MRPRLAAVSQDAVVVTTGLFQGIGQDRQAVELAFLVDGFSKVLHGRREVLQVRSDRHERVAENVTEEITLDTLL
jgi:hypothetical protein